MVGWILLGIASQTPGASNVATRTSRGPGLIHVSESRSNGALTGLEFVWDMGDRSVRDVRLGGSTQTDGLADPATRTTLRVRFSARGKDRADATVEWRTRGPHGSGTSTTRGEIAIDGGLAAIRRLDVDRAKPVRMVALLRWNDRRAKAPPALTVTFR